MFGNKKKEKTKEPRTIPSLLNNPMTNYRTFFLNSKQKLFWTLLIFVLGGIVGLVFYGGMFKKEGEATIATYISNSIFFVLVGMVATKFFVPVVRNILKKRRDNQLKKQFMDLLETLSTALGAGGTVNDAFISAAADLRNQYGDNDMIIVELDEIVTGLNNGQTIEALLDNFGKRSGNEDIENFANVMGNCYRMGGDFKNVVRKTRDIISDKIQISEEINTKLTSNKIQLNAMSVMPIVIVAMIKITGSSFAENLATPLGAIVTTFAILIFVGAYIWGNKIIDVK